MAKVYTPEPSATWWSRRWPYRIFMLRELSAVFAAIYMILFLLLVDRVRDGDVSGYFDFLQNPIVILFHLVALAFAVLHTVTWFQAIPKAMVIKQGGKRVPSELLIGGAYAAWAVTSLIILVLFLA